VVECRGLNRDMSVLPRSCAPMFVGIRLRVSARTSVDVRQRTSRAMSGLNS
jgi:hypothetical protein